MGLIIGLCGHPGAGKTEVRKILTEELGFGLINSKAIIYSFAAQLTGLPETHFSDPQFKNTLYEDVPLRHICGHLGYAIEDCFGQDYLIRKSIQNFVTDARKHKNFVVDSLRMQQPILLKDELYVVEVVRDSCKGTGNHFDEYQTPSGHWIIYNDRDITTLREEVKKLLYDIKVSDF